MPLFILIKRKGAKKPLGAVPVKKGVSRSKIRSSLRGSLRSGLTYRIVDAASLKSLIKRMALKKGGRRSVKRKRRRKGPRRKKR